MALLVVRACTQLFVIIAKATIRAVHAHSKEEISKYNLCTEVQLVLIDLCPATAHGHKFNDEQHNAYLAAHAASAVPTHAPRELRVQRAQI